jgi:small subunit ribosomal protein S16
MLKIRLQRTGRKNDPSFRVVVIDSHRGPKTGNYLEMLGSYAPRRHAVALKKERILHWISKGAQVSGTMHNLLITEGVRQGKKVNVLPRKRPIVSEKEEATEAAPAPAVEAVTPAEPGPVAVNDEEEVAKVAPAPKAKQE